MRINNPKSLAGFTKNSDDNNYKLATVGQLNTAIHDINEKFIKLLVGTTDNVSNGLGGIINKCGYAWIASNGKISPDLIPSLAITNTYVIKQSVLTDINDETVNINQNSDVLELLAYWRAHVVEETDTTYNDMQQGDIIIVTPDEDVVINPKICGSYIITRVDSDSTNNNTVYTFAKLAYEDGKIVTINDKAPTNSSGSLTLALSDILKVGQNNEIAQALSDNIYRISSNADLSIGEDKFRFVFNGVPYATSAELSNFIEKETKARSDADNYISGIVDIINNRIGADNQNINRATSGQIYPQLRGLRADVDHNANILDNVILSTNTYLDNLNSGLSALNKKAIELNEYTISWEADNLTDTVSGTNDNIEIDYQDNGEASIGIKTQSYTVWKYKFTPNSNFEDERIIAVFDENGNKIDVDITRNSDKSSIIEIYLNIINDENSNNINVLTNKTMKILVASTIKFDEKILATDKINIANSKQASSSAKPTTTI